MKQRLMEIEIKATTEQNAWLQIRKLAHQEGYSPDIIPNGYHDRTSQLKSLLILTGYFQQTEQNILKITAKISDPII